MTNEANTPIELNKEEVETAPTPAVDELTTLKARADMLGITYHPSIGVEKLREKVINAMNSESTPEEDESIEFIPDAPTEPEPIEETATARRERKRREANELVRIIVTCMNPAKKEWEGEMFTVGNSVVGSFGKFVPFNIEDGWHVPRIIYNTIKERQCQIFVSDKKGGRTPKLIKEFGINVLPNLTPEELQELAQRQAMSNSIG